jgi:small subunit ribosomal protein S16
MLKIRLRRMGKRHRPFYRVVVSDSRSVPSAPAVEEIGHYDPMHRPPDVRIDLERVEHWSGQGAQLSPTVKKLVKGIRTGRIDRAAEAAAKAAKEAPKKAAPAPEAAAEAPVEVETPADEAAPATEAAAEETPEAEAAEATEAEATAEAVAVDEEAEVKASGAEAKDEKTVETEAAEAAADEPEAAIAEAQQSDTGEATDQDKA